MNSSDINAIPEVHRLAFSEAEGEETAQLAKGLLGHLDTISISVRRDRWIASDMLFTSFVFKN